MTGHSLHFRTNVRLQNQAHLFHPQTPYKISISEHFHPNNHFDTAFDKTLKNQCFSPIPTSLKITIFYPKIPSNPSKINLSSNSLKIFKKLIQIIQNKTPTPTPFHPQKSSISSNSIMQISLSHRTHQKSHRQSKHLTLISDPNLEYGADFIYLQRYII